MSQLKEIKDRFLSNGQTISTYNRKSMSGINITQEIKKIINGGDE